MNSDDTLREDLKAFIDGELNPERAAEVQAALDRDPALREEHNFMKLLSGEIKSAAAEPQVKGLQEAVDKVSKKQPTWSFPRWGLYAAGAVCAIFFFGLVGPRLMPQGGRMLAPGAEPAARSAIGAAPTAGAEAQDLKGFDGGGGAMPNSTRMDTDAKAGSAAGPESESSAPSSGLAKTLSKAEPDWPAEKGQAGAGVGAYSTELGARTSSATKPPPGSTRKIIRSGDIGVKVKDVAKSVEETERQVNAMGGFVESTNFNEGTDEASATMQFQVPEKNFTAMVETLGKMGKVFRKSINGNDVTGQIANTDGKITSLADEEKNLIQELTRARGTDARLEIRARLSSVRQQMEGLKQENKALKDLADMSRMTLVLQKAGELDQVSTGDWFGQSTQGASQVAGNIGRVFGTGLIYTVFLAPFWLPVGLLVWWLRKRAAR